MAFILIHFKMVRNHRQRGSHGETTKLKIPKGAANNQIATLTEVDAKASASVDTKMAGIAAEAFALRQDQYQQAKKSRTLLNNEAVLEEGFNETWVEHYSDKEGWFDFFKVQLVDGIFQFSGIDANLDSNGGGRKRTVNPLPQVRSKSTKPTIMATLLEHMTLVFRPTVFMQIPIQRTIA